MATELYAQGLIYADGVLIADEVSFTCNYDPQNNVVLTQAKGFAGITPGAGQTNISITEAIPRLGTSIEWIKYSIGRTPIEVVAFIGSKKWSAKGFVGAVDTKAGVNSTSEHNVTIVAGEPTIS